MENSKTQARTINLGKQLVAELDQESEADFLCRWMAHYLAEQITLAENSAGHKKKAAQKKCFETILALWRHRAAFPNGHRPFEKFEPVLDALRNLNPNNPRPYYHRFKPATKETDSREPKMVSKLIDLIFGIDSAARVLVDATLTEITELAITERTKSMLKNAPKTSSQDSTDVIRILIEGMELPETDLDVSNRLIHEQLKKLKDFSAACKILEVQLERRLKKHPSTSHKEMNL
jgi:hypothetical protein